MIIFLEQNLVDNPSIKGGVCMFIQEHFPFSVHNIEKFCKDKDLEVCVLKLDLLPFKICIITVYRAPTGNFQYFIRGLHNIILKKLLNLAFI